MPKLFALTLPTLPVGDHPDHIVSGLILKVGYKNRSWTLRYRTGSTRKRVLLGYYPKMTLLAAREAAKQVMERVETGAPAVVAPVVHPRKELSLADLIDRYEALRIKEGADASNRTFLGGFRAIRSGLKDHLNTPAKAFTKADLRSARDKIAERAPYMANRFLAYLGPVLKWAAQEDIISHNPVPDLRKFTETSRDRVLSHSEVARIWHACDKLDGGPSARAFGRLTKFLLLSLQRRDEVAQMKHGHVLDGVWHQRQNKSKRPHKLRLPPMGLELIGTCEAANHCFSGVRGAISGFSKLKKQLDQLSGVYGWRLHDLRRTGASQMQELGISRDVIQGVLNHSISDVGGVYLRGEMEKAKGAALAAWANELERVVDAKQAVS
jgi:integrase